MTGFPRVRLRRLRRSGALRGLVRETHLDVGDLIAPLFVVEGRAVRQEIPSMPGVYRFSPDEAAGEAEKLAGLGIPGVLLFGIPSYKDDTGSSARDPQGVVPQAVEAIKRAVPDLIVITDVCLCEYTSHGHCGVVQGSTVDNDRTLPLLAEAAV
ncbi:MAG: porphobilinogen synthase, partial [Dehalococcoidales bacterium]|nr:porphobilinogen synthase [Dehalococcoidales bacterium]